VRGVRDGDEVHLWVLENGEIWTPPSGVRAIYRRGHIRFDPAAGHERSFS
jgi:hypothetical protein